MNLKSILKESNIYPIFGDLLKGQPHVFDFSSKNPKTLDYNLNDFQEFNEDIFNELKNFCGEDREIQVSRELTKKYEEHIGHKIDEVIKFFEDKEVIGEITVVIKGIDKKMCIVNEAS